ncbi:tyrosine-type recombinase/integrase [Nocardia sp. NRRL S-836]|uniref:tyrosine-type recombinase/integrase n=1 Tax=Nocardia sp. NRRL S-836 TaxID=1519492 RepID=UPI0006AF2231|nr:tyrosine-type recombinase/integrase [Nocardia sp. NRRL S-836]
MTAALPLPVPRAVPAMPTKEPSPAELTDVLAELVAGLPALPPDTGDRYGLRALTRVFLRQLKTHNTRRSYWRGLGEWLSYCDWYRIDPMSARLLDVDEWRTDWLDSDTPQTVRNRLAAVSAWYQYLINNQACEVNPAKLVARPEREGRDPKVLTSEEIGRLLHYAVTEAERLGTEAALRRLAVIELMLVTGVRTGAVLHATCGPGGDLFSTGGHQVLRYRNKGGKEKLAVVPPWSMRSLFAYQTARAAREGVDVDQLAGMLFVTITGTALTSRDIRNLVKETATGAGLSEVDRITPHTLRHSAAHLLLDQKKGLLEIMDFLGHADPRTTLIYLASRNLLDNNPSYGLAGALSDAEANAAREPDRAADDRRRATPPPEIMRAPENDPSVNTGDPTDCSGAVVLTFRPRRTGTGA